MYRPPPCGRVQRLLADLRLVLPWQGAAVAALGLAGGAEGKPPVPSARPADPVRAEGHHLRPGPLPRRHPLCQLRPRRHRLGDPRGGRHAGLHERRGQLRALGDVQRLRGGVLQGLVRASGSLGASSSSAASQMVPAATASPARPSTTPHSLPAPAAATAPSRHPLPHPSHRRRHRRRNPAARRAFASATRSPATELSMRRSLRTVYRTPGRATASRSSATG